MTSRPSKTLLELALADPVAFRFARHAGLFAVDASVQFAVEELGLGFEVVSASLLREASESATERVVVTESFWFAAGSARWLKRTDDAIRTAFDDYDAREATA